MTKDDYGIYVQINDGDVVVDNGTGRDLCVRVGSLSFETITIPAYGSVGFPVPWWMEPFPFSPFTNYNLDDFLK